jgi:hypothetical protein
MWVTKLSGADAWVGITVEGDRGVAFVCGGYTTLETFTRWMLTDVTSETVVFRKDDFELEVTLSEGDIGGQLVEPSGAAVAFEARRVGETDVAGVYFGFDSGCGDGLIVLDNGAGGASEALGAWCDESGTRAQVTPVLPIERTDGGVAAFVEVMSERRDFLMTRVDPGSVTP